MSAVLTEPSHAPLFNFVKGLHAVFQRGCPLGIPNGVEGSWFATTSAVGVLLSGKGCRFVLVLF